MDGSGYAVMQCNAFLTERGGSGFRMHLRRWDARVANRYEVRNECAYCEWVNVVWQLRDVTLEDAGFTVVPATRKGGNRHLKASRTPPKIPWVCSKHVPMKAVAGLLLLDSAQAHGPIRLAARDAPPSVCDRFAC